MLENVLKGIDDGLCVCKHLIQPKFGFSYSIGSNQELVEKCEYNV